MFFGGTRAALLIESKDKNGNPAVMVYHLTEPMTINMEREFMGHYNVFDGNIRHLPMPTRISFEAYLADPNPHVWDGKMPDAGEQAEIEPVHLAIESNEPEEIVIDEDGFEEYRGED